MIDEVWVSKFFPKLSNVALLASGGQKVVFSADHNLNGPIVLKLIRENQNPERTNRENIAVSKINSPRVPQILQTGTVKAESGDVIWILENRISGSSLRQLIEHSCLPLSQIVRIAVQILEALSSAESVNIVHRDIKPENIMRDSNNDYWLLDFGIARHLDLVSITPTDAPQGPSTLGYAPPEQYQNRKKEIDIRADLFALGVTLSEAATGHHPFRHGARDIWEVRRRTESASAPTLQISGDKGNKVAEFIATMMRRRPDHRPRTAELALSWARELQQQYPCNSL